VLGHDGVHRRETVYYNNYVRHANNPAIPRRPESVYVDDFFSTANGSTTSGPWNPLTVRGISNYPAGNYCFLSVLRKQLTFDIRTAG